MLLPRTRNAIGPTHQLVQEFWRSGDRKCFGTHLTVCSLGQQTHPILISPVPVCGMEIDTLTPGRVLHFGFLNLGVKVIREERTNYLRTTPCFRVNHRQYYNHGGDWEISNLMKLWILEGLAILIITPLTSFFGSCENHVGHWRLTDFHKLHQIKMATAYLILYMVSLPDKSIPDLTPRETSLVSPLVGKKH